jgi:integrase
MTTEFTAQDICTDPKVKKFFEEKRVGLKSGTKKGYIIALRSFCNFTEKTPTEIYYLHKKDLDERAPEYDQWLPDTFDEYVAELSKNHAHDTIALYISKIKSFLKAFRLKPLPEVEINKKRVYEDAKHALKVEDIRKAIQNSPPTYKTLMITQAQTGLAVGDAVLLDVEDFILAVKYSDLSPQYWPKPGEKTFTHRDLEEAIEKTKINDNLIGCFDLHRKKTKNEFYTFAGPECLRSIASLLESRNHHLNPDSPIFLKDPVKISKKHKKEVFEDMRLLARAANNYFKRLHDQKKLFPKIIVDGKPRNYFRTHKLRKWFAEKSKYHAKLDTDDVKYLMGQKTGDVFERYANPNNYLNLKNKYRKALPHLAITTPVKVQDNYEIIEKLTQENQEQQGNIDFLMNVITENPYLTTLNNDPQAREILNQYIAEKKKEGK